MRVRCPVTVAVVAIALSACGSPDSPTSLADRTTQAVYAVDVGATEAKMDEELKKQVTRASIGDLSDKMHALGGYKGIKPTSSDPDRGRYSFAAAFDRGTLAVELRLDPSGKIGAYRVGPASN